MTHLQNDHANDLAQNDADGAKAVYVPSYRSLLKAPTVLLAGNQSDRPDVANVAILGYN